MSSCFKTKCGGGNYPATISTHCRLPAAAARQCQPAQPSGHQRDPLCRRTRVQVARTAKAPGQLAHHLHAHEPLEQGRRARPGLCPAPERTDHRPQAGGGVPGQHDRQGASRWDRGFKKNGPQSIGKSRGGWTTKIHLVAAHARCALSFALSPGHAGDAPQGRALLRAWGAAPTAACHLIMDRAYEGDETRQLALELGFSPVVPPKSNRLSPWEYDRAMYRRRNEIERLFRRLKGFRRIFSRFDKLDVMFTAFIHIALIVDALVSVNTP